MIGTAAIESAWALARFTARHRRALTEHIYVVGCSPESAVFEVQGASDMTYVVTLLPTPRCTCMDFACRRDGSEVCKHIINVVCRALHMFSTVLEPPLNRLEYERQVVVAMAQHQQRLQSFASGKPGPLSPPHRENQASDKLDAECAICFEEINGTDSVWGCGACGHRLHQGCWKRWKKRSPTCPFCRHDSSIGSRSYLS